MMWQTVKKLVYWAGPSSAPIYCLTQEEGGPTYKDIAEFCSEIDVSDSNIDCPKFNHNWLPTQEELDCIEKHPRKSLGTPGKFISVLMSNLVPSEITKDQYRLSMIYMKNECNVRFFPLQRSRNTYKGEPYWPKVCQDITGFDSHDIYVKASKEFRKLLFCNHDHLSFTTDKFYVIGVRGDYWIEVLEHIFCQKLEAKRCFAAGRSFVDGYYDKFNKLVAVYAPLTQWQASNPDTLFAKAAELIKTKRPDLLDRLV